MPDNGNGTVRVEACKLDHITSMLISASEDLQILMDRLRSRMTTDAERDDMELLRDVQKSVRAARSGISRIHPCGTERESNRAEAAHSP